MSSPTSHHSSDMHEKGGSKDPCNQESDEDTDYSSSSSFQSSATGVGPRRNDKGKHISSNGSARSGKRETKEF